MKPDLSLRAIPHWRAAKNSLTKKQKRHWWVATSSQRAQHYQRESAPIEGAWHASGGSR